MTPILLAIVAQVCFVLSSTFDKRLMNAGHAALLTNSQKMLLNTGIVLLWLGFLPSTQAFRPFPLEGVLLGLLYAVAGVLYFSYVRLVRVSVIIPLAKSFELCCLFVLSALIFSESITALESGGALFAAVGCYILLRCPSTPPKDFQKALVFVALNTALTMSLFLLSKHFLFSVDSISLAFTMYFTAAAGLFFYWRFIRKRDTKSFFTIPRELFIAALLGGSGTVLIFQALATGEAAHISVTKALHVVALQFTGRALAQESFQRSALFAAFLVGLGITLNA